MSRLDAFKARVAADLAVTPRGGLVMFNSKDSKITVPSFSAPVPPTPPVWVPTGAKAFVDFVNGKYYAARSERSISELVVEDAAHFGVFDISGITPGVGLTETVRADTSQSPRLIGPLLEDAFPSSTFVIEINGSDPQVSIYFTSDPVSFAGFYAFAGTSGSNVQASGIVALGNQASAGTNKLAVSFDALNGRIAASLKGQAVGVDTRLPFTAIAISLTSQQNLRSVAIYPPKSDDQLILLSA